MEASSGRLVPEELSPLKFPAALSTLQLVGFRPSVITVTAMSRHPLTPHMAIGGLFQWWLSECDSRMEGV